jgi:hypothetical protein
VRRLWITFAQGARSLLLRIALSLAVRRQKTIMTRTSSSFVSRIGWPQACGALATVVAAFVVVTMPALASGVLAIAIAMALENARTPLASAGMATTTKAATTIARAAQACGQPMWDTREEVRVI